MSDARRVARSLPPLGKHMPGGAQGSSAPQVGNPNFGQLSPLTAQLQTGGSQGPTWSYAYGGFLPRRPQDFTEGAFGPFSPILPTPIDAPASDQTPRAAPRWWEYPTGWNLPVGTPGSEPGSKMADFATLRTLADLYSVARACIELRKNEIRGLNWDIMPTKDAAKTMRGSQAKAKDFGQRRGEAIKFFNHCDPDYSTWTEFLGVVLEELLVYDTLALLMQPAWGGNGKGVFGSDLKHLRLVTAPTIRPLVDMHGAKPRPPAPAFQQYLFGVPRTDLMTMITQEDIADYKGLEGPAFRGDQLLYHRMTPRRWTPYGYAPIEQALIPVMAGLQKQGYQLDFFREGTVPAVYIAPGGTNANMTPNQIRELQDALNAVAGDVAWKHKIIVLPPDSKVMPQKPTEIADQFDEIVMNQVCMAFGVQPMELGIMPKVSTTVSPGASNQMAKASASTHERKATKPMLTFLTSIFNMILQDVCGQDDMQFMFEGLEEDEDEQTQTAMLVTQIGAGLRSIDEARNELGMQPWGLPETVDPGWATPTGFVPLGQLTPTGEAAPGQQPNALNPAIAQPAGAAQSGKPGAPPAKPTGGPAKPSGSGSAPAKPAPKPSGGSGGAAASPGQAAAQAADAEGGTKSAVPTANKMQETHQARRDQRVEEAAQFVRMTISQAVADYQDGRITHAQAMTDSQGVLADGYRKAMDAASQDAAADYAGVSAIDVSGLAALRAAQQTEFLSGLMKASLGEVGLDWMNSRLTAYENTVSGAYNQAFGQTVQASQPSYQIIWHLGASEHCKLCIDRDGKVFTFNSLPGYPGDGGFGGQCMGGPNCHCSLEYVEPGMDSLWGTNTQLPEATPYYRQQLDDIMASRADAVAARQDFLDQIPDGAAMRAMTRDQIAQELADAENAAIRAGGGYTGVSVEWGDVPAADIAALVPDYAKSEGLRKAVDSELAALARHYRKGRSIISWKPRHIDSQMIMSIEEDVTKGLTIEEAIEVAKAQRRVLITGEVAWAQEPDYQLGPVAAARVPAGGGGRELPARDVDGIEVGAGRVPPRQPEVPGGAPGASPGGEPPRWAPPEGISSGETMSTPRRRVRSAPPDEDDADEPGARGVPVPPGGGPRGGAPSGPSHGTGQAGISSPPGAVKGAADPSDPNPVDSAHVKNLMLDNFPPKALKWVDDARWIGPVDVALDRVDVGDVDGWAASHQPERVKHFAQLLKKGKPVKPGICVQEPGETKVKVIDGHHRYLAAKSLGIPFSAYVGFVDANGGVWDETHSYQVHQGADPSNKAEKLPKTQVHYRHHSGGRSCGNWVMFRVSGDDESGSCTLVEGNIRSDDVCDRWAGRSEKSAGPIAAGLVVVARDTGRVLMLQRALSDDDPAGGSWEFPGGRLDDGERIEDAAVREWQEETGMKIPAGEPQHGWTSYNGVYQGFVLPIEREADLPIHDGRDQVDPDPDDDQVESLAWWDPDQLRGNPVVRGELHADMNGVLQAVGDAGKGMSAVVRKLAEQMHKAGNPKALQNWYATGAHGAISWGGAGDLTACHAIASRHMSSDQAWGFCQERQIQATGKPNPRD